MKKILTILSVVALTVVFTASGAFAYSFDFAGGFELRDDDSTGFAEVLNFNFGLGNKSFIQTFDPGPDAVLDEWSYVMLSEFTLDESAYTSGVSYSFANNPYADGFSVYNSVGILVLQADIALDPIKIDGGTGTINASFGMNLTDIEVFVPGSPILDAFVAPGVPGGAVNFTFNIAAADLVAKIEQGGGHGSYSASAAPVPEPGTVLLLGAGLVGLIGLGRKFKK